MYTHVDIHNTYICMYVCIYIYIYIYIHNNDTTSNNNNDNTSNTTTTNNNNNSDTHCYCYYYYYYVYMLLYMIIYVCQGVGVKPLAVLSVGRSAVVRRQSASTSPPVGACVLSRRSATTLRQGPCVTYVAPDGQTRHFNFRESETSAPAVTYVLSALKHYNVLYYVMV